jgi:hypothetical protein
MKSTYVLFFLCLALSACQEDLTGDLLVDDSTLDLASEGTRGLNHDPELEATIAQGLVAFRKPGRTLSGAACNDCHASPDGFEFAVFDFGKANIIRRAVEHVSAEDAEDIVNMVEAIRKKYNITELKSPREFRLFQPGGTVLAGKTPQERDFNFLKNELPRWSPTVVSTVADSKELALKVRDELAAIDLQQMPVGIPMPLWSSDSFHGNEFGTIDEWLPNLPCFTEDEAYRQVQQAYLNNPTQETFKQLLAATNKYTSCPDNLERIAGPHPKTGRELGGQIIARHKYYGVLIADFVMRQQALGLDPMKPDLALPWTAKQPLADIGGRGRFNIPTNHIWEVGTTARKLSTDYSLVSGKYHLNSDQAMLEAMGYEDFTVEGQTLGYGHHYFSDQLQASWFWLNSMFDNQRNTDYFISAVEMTGYSGHARVRQGHTQLAYYGDWSWSYRGRYYPNFYYTLNVDKQFEGQPQEYKDLFVRVETNIAWATLYTAQEYITNGGRAYDNNGFSGLVKAAWCIYLRGGDYSKAKEIYYDICEKSAVRAGSSAAKGRASGEERLMRHAAGKGHHHAG